MRSTFLDFTLRGSVILISGLALSSCLTEMESKSELEVIQPENSPRAEMIRSNLRCQYQLLDQFEYEPGVANSNGFFPPGPRQLFVSSKGSYFEVGTGIDSQFSRWVVRKNEQLDTKWRTVDDGSQFGDLSTEPRFIREIGNSLIVGGQKDIGWGATTVAAFRRSFDNGESWESLPDYLIHQSVYSPWSRTNVENCMAYDGDKLSCIVYTQHNLGLEFPEFPEAIKVSQTIKLINGEWIASPLRAHYREQDLEQGDRVVGPFRLADHNFYRLLIRKSKVIVLQKSADSIKWVNFSSNDFPIKDYVSVGAVKAIDGTLFFYLDITTIDPLTIGHVIQHDHYYYRFDSVKQILEVTPLGSQSFTNGNGKIAETPFSPRYIKKMDNKLVLIGSKGTAPMAAMISEDQGKTWYESTVFVDGSDDYSMDRKNLLSQDGNTFVFGGYSLGQLGPEYPYWLKSEVWTLDSLSCELEDKKAQEDETEKEPEVIELPEFCGGTGEAENPYLICNGQQLVNIGLEGVSEKAFRLANDIDLFGISFSIREFNGELDGAGHTISNFGYPVAASEPFIDLNYGSIHNFNFVNFKFDSNRAGGAFLDYNDKSGVVRDISLVGGQVSVDSYFYLSAGVLVNSNYGLVNKVEVKDTTLLLRSPLGLKRGSGASLLVGYNYGRVDSSGAISSSILDGTESGNPGWFTGLLIGINYMTGSVSNLYASDSTVAPSLNDNNRFIYWDRSSDN